MQDARWTRSPPTVLSILHLSPDKAPSLTAFLPYCLTAFSPFVWNPEVTRLVILWVGPIRSRPIRALTDDYLRRIRRWVPCEVREVPERSARDPHQEAAHRRAETAALTAQVRELDDWIVLTPSGSPWSTEQWLRWWTEAAAHGRRVGVVLGGPRGLSPALEAAAPHRVALAPITMSHEMARAVFLELMYRILSLWKGTPYAK